MPVALESGFHVESLFPKSIELPPPINIQEPPAQPVLPTVPFEEEAYLAEGIVDGRTIEQIQVRLIELCYLTTVNGVYDEKTAAAIWLFQERLGLPADGIAGEDTLEALHAISNEQAYTPVDVERMLEYAVSAIGKKYEFGMEGPDSFDASGLAYYCLRMAGGDYPRLSAGQYAEQRDWEKIAEMDQLKAGDLMFFYSTERDRVTHMSIVLDDTYIIRASSSVGEVVKSSYRMDYWKTHFVCGRRIG